MSDIGTDVLVLVLLASQATGDNRSVLITLADGPRSHRDADQNTSKNNATTTWLASKKLIQHPLPF